MNDFSKYLIAIDAEMRAVIRSDDPLVKDFYGWLHYHLGWADENFQPAQGTQGKRLRPIFCLLVCESICGEFAPALPAAAAIEIVHNFSLIHDDIEDGDEVRHHRPTLWKMVGVPHAINAGDALFALAQHELLRLGERGVSAERTLRASQIFQRTCVQLVEGQYLDMRGEQVSESSLANYKRMIGDKTAALLGAATAIGAAVATDDAQFIERYNDFGIELGLAFQMTDDILGLWGDPALTGKPIGADIRKRKKSLPIILAQAHGGELSAALQYAFAQAAMNDADVEHLMTLMDAAGIQAQAGLEAEKHRHRAMRTLKRIGETNEAGQTLAALAESLTKRDR